MVVRKTIVLLNTAETTRDPRVRRVGRSLLERGHRVVVVNPTGEVAAPREVHEGLEIERVAPPKRYGRGDLAALARLSEEAYAIVRGAHRAVTDLPLLGAYYAYRRWHQRGARALERAPGHRLSGRLWGRLAPPAQESIGRIRSTMMLNVALAQQALAARPDVIHANDLDTLVAGFVVARKLGIPLVYDAHEIYPEQFVEAERTALWHQFYTGLEQGLITRTDARMTVCDALGTYFVRRYGAQPFVTIRNLPSIRLLGPPPRPRAPGEPAELLYHGALFKHRGLDELVEAAQYLRSARVVLRGFGDHTAALQARIEQLGVGERVRIAPPVAVDALIGHAAASHVGLNPFPAAALNTQYALPNKFFEYMMAGLAVVSSDLVELRRLTTALDIGVLFRALEPRAMAEDLEALVADGPRLEAQRQRAYQHARETLHWEVEEERLAALYAGVGA